MHRESNKEIHVLALHPVSLLERQRTNYLVAPFSAMHSLTGNTSNRTTVTVKNVFVEEDRRSIFSLEPLRFIEGGNKKWHSRMQLMCKIERERLEGIEEQ